MNPGYLAYQLLTTCGAAVVIPLIWLHHRYRGENFARFYHRLGLYPNNILQNLVGQPRIWLHAVSVGEVGVAAAIGNELLKRRPECQLMISTTREQGFARARSLMGERAACFFAPLDILGPTRKAIYTLKPDVLALLETEIWPNMIVNAHRNGTPTAIINGRLSVRSIKRYHKVRSLMKFTLSHIDAFSMISRDDALRLESLGAPVDRMSVNGNAKFDSPISHSDNNTENWAANLLGLDEQTPVFVAGSTRHLEEPIILDAYQKIRNRFPNCLLVIAPRHIERVDQIAEWIADRGLSYQRRTELDQAGARRTSPVVILDTMGELAMMYSIADIVFCGGSLVPKGGQNLLEPALCGKPVLYGPSMEDFADAHKMIDDAGGGVTVHDSDSLAAAAIGWLADPQKAQAVGNAARLATLPHRGAARKHADVICELLANSSNR